MYGEVAYGQGVLHEIKGYPRDQGMFYEGTFIDDRAEGFCTHVSRGFYESGYELHGEFKQHAYFGKATRSTE